MQGVVFLGHRQAVVREFADPTPGPGEVRIRIRAAGVCGSDMHRFRRAQEGDPLAPIIPGHEACGVIDEVGAGVRGLAPGDRVFAYMAQGCGRCAWCRRGDFKYCPTTRGLGWHVHGSMAEYVVANASSCFLLPPAVDFPTGMLFTCVVGTAYRISREVELSGQDVVAIYGLGPVGLAGAMIARALGASVIGIDPVAERRAMAVELGAIEVIDPAAADPVARIAEMTGGDGADAGIDYSGNEAAQRKVLESVRHYGRVGLVGVNEARVTIDPEVILFNQLRISGSYTYTAADVPEMVRFVERHGLPLGRLITHRFPLTRAPDALALFDLGQTGKIALVGDGA